jgi:hypothetical protein
LGLLGLLALAACGGGDAIDNPAGTPGQKLSYAYFQRCVAPLLSTPLTVTVNGSTSSNTCASSGCHDNTSGTGGALRLFGSAPAQDLTLPAATLRAGDMFKNYTSALGESVTGAPDLSRLLNKPLVRGVLHGGGQVLASPQDLAALRISYWINHPMPQGQDEFSTASAGLFTPADTGAGVCNQ